jgi:hypothetical protein
MFIVREYAVYVFAVFMLAALMLVIYGIGRLLNVTVRIIMRRSVQSRNARRHGTVLPLNHE